LAWCRLIENLYPNPKPRLLSYCVSPSDRVSGALFLQNKRYAQAMELAKKDKLYKDAMETAATSLVRPVPYLLASFLSCSLAFLGALLCLGQAGGLALWSTCLLRAAAHTGAVLLHMTPNPEPETLNPKP
jgi:hypothetical protein